MLQSQPEPQSTSDSSNSKIVFFTLLAALLVLIAANIFLFRTLNFRNLPVEHTVETDKILIEDQPADHILQITRIILDKAGFLVILPESKSPIELVAQPLYLPAGTYENLGFVFYPEVWTELSGEGHGAVAKIFEDTDGNRVFSKEDLPAKDEQGRYLIRQLNLTEPQPRVLSCSDGFTEDFETGEIKGRWDYSVGTFQREGRLVQNLDSPGLTFLVSKDKFRGDFEATLDILSFTPHFQNQPSQPVLAELVLLPETRRIFMVRWYKDGQDSYLNYGFDLQGEDQGERFQIPSSAASLRVRRVGSIIEISLRQGGGYQRVWQDQVSDEAVHLVLGTWGLDSELQKVQAEFDNFSISCPEG